MQQKHEAYSAVRERERPNYRSNTSRALMGALPYAATRCGYLYPSAVSALTETIVEASHFVHRLVLKRL